MVWLMMLGGLAMAAGNGTDTGSAEDTGSGTDDTPDPDTGMEATDTVCGGFGAGDDPCSTAGELAGEPGGSPCADGCDSTGGGLAATGVVALSAWAARRRQRAITTNRR